MPEELVLDPMAILGAVLLAGGAAGLLRWLDAWAPWGGLERSYRGILLVNLAAILPELTVAATALALRDLRLAEGALAASALWRFGMCGLLGMALPTGRNPLLPGRNLANFLPAVVLVVCILVYVAGIIQAPRRDDPAWRVPAGAMVLVPYLGCLWLVWRSGAEWKGSKPPAEPEDDLVGDPGPRPGIPRVLGAMLAVAAGGILLAWQVDGALRMLTTAFGPDPTRRVPAYTRHVLLILGAFLALPGAIQTWCDRRREATGLRPARELLACSTLLVALQLMGLGLAGKGEVLASLAILGLLVGGALAVLFASVERFVPVQVRGLTILLIASGMLVLAWRM